MEVMVILIGFSLIVALGFLAAFFWAVRSGQFDDSVTPSYRVLFDERSPSDKRTSSNRSASAAQHKQHSSTNNPNQTEPDR
jgi:cbb3-type cytochrome oxidase maturation protein